MLTPDDVTLAESQMAAAGAPVTMQLWCMIETPLAMLNIKEIAAKAETSLRMNVWVMGTNDIAKELRCQHTPERMPMMTSLGLAMLAARAYGLVILDGVYNDIKDEEGFLAICEQGRDLGMDGKTLIHPSQVGPCNKVFSPDSETVEFSRKVIEAFDQPENQGKGVLKVDGKMVEILHAEIARRVVNVADQIAELEKGA